MFVPYDLKQVTSKENHQLSRKVGDPCHTLAKENACGSAVVAIQGNLIGRDSGGPQGVGASDDGVMYTLTKADVHGVAQPIAFTSEQTPKASSNLAHTLTNTTFKHNQMVAFSSNMSVPDCQIDVSPTLKLGGKGGGNPPAVAQPIPIDTMNHIGRKDSHSFGDFEPGAPSYTLTKGHSHAVATNMAVRRLTPVECERLQGFPDNYTNIRESCPDGPRYKALGNSMAVPVMRWIGERIQAVERI